MTRSMCSRFHYCITNPWYSENWLSNERILLCFCVYLGKVFVIRGWQLQGGSERTKLTCLNITSLYVDWFYFIDMLSFSKMIINTNVQKTNVNIMQGVHGLGVVVLLLSMSVKEIKGILNLGQYWCRYEKNVAAQFFDHPVDNGVNNVSCFVCFLCFCLCLKCCFVDASIVVFVLFMLSLYQMIIIFNCKYATNCTFICVVCCLWSRHCC